MISKVSSFLPSIFALLKSLFIIVLFSTFFLIKSAAYFPGINKPLSLYFLANKPNLLFFFISFLIKSPVEIIGSFNFLLNILSCVPLPQPGVPSKTILIQNTPLIFLFFHLLFSRILLISQWL